MTFFSEYFQSGVAWIHRCGPRGYEGPDCIFYPVLALVQLTASEVTLEQIKSMDLWFMWPFGNAMNLRVRKLKDEMQAWLLRGALRPCWSSTPLPKSRPAHITGLAWASHKRPMGMSSSTLKHHRNVHYYWQNEADCARGVSRRFNAKILWFSEMRLNPISKNMKKRPS